MIIIAIPKSASTSLLQTLGKYQKLPAKQDFSIRNNSIPKNCSILHKLHSDVRELKTENVKTLTDPSQINKQHIYPSPNNIELLKDIKKVVLLRDIDDIIGAYRRGAIKKVHNILPGYSTEMTYQEWLDKSKTDGLYSDLNFFYNEWNKYAHLENIMIINYETYIDNPKKVINEIEKFYHLPITQSSISTVKVRYSRYSRFDILKQKIKQLFK